MAWRGSTWRSKVGNLMHQCLRTTEEIHCITNQKLEMQVQTIGIKMKLKSHMDTQQPLGYRLDFFTELAFTLLSNKV